VTLASELNDPNNHPQTTTSNLVKTQVHQPKRLISFKIGRFNSLNGHKNRRKFASSSRPKKLSSAKKVQEVSVEIRQNKKSLEELRGINLLMKKGSRSE
jgi:hypothetical protein